MCWFQVTEACQESQGFQVFLERKENMDLLELVFLARLVLKVGPSIVFIPALLFKQRKFTT